MEEDSNFIYIGLELCIATLVQASIAWSALIWLDVVYVVRVNQAACRTCFPCIQCIGTLVQYHFHITS